METYGFDADPEGALERMTDAETETLILHELGESLADCRSTLPALLDRDARGSLHFYFAHREGLRRELFPSLTATYLAWCETGDSGPLRAAAERGREHWLQAARRVRNLLAANPAAVEPAVERLLSGEFTPLAL
ncbi:MAG TPA: hypothetical protein VF104_03915 [Burkholderiales bacterium]